MSEWAERNRYIPEGGSASPGQWRTESYQREILDALLDPLVREVSFMKCTQIGWSEILNNSIGYFIDIDPKPIMLVQPTDHTAKDYSKKRITPMIDNCPVLRSKVREATSRRAGNTMLLKQFDGGFLKVVGANAGPGLRSDPIAILLFDEVDGYPDDVDGEGDPMEIARRRTDTFDDAKILKGSTPAKPKGFSRIETEFDRSDQRRYFVHCPYEDCGHEQVLWWKDPVTAVYRLTWEKDSAGDPIPSSVRYVCENCGRGIDEKYKRRMLDGGRWKPTNPGGKGVGFHINALYSPWRAVWPDLAQEWKDAQDNPEKLKAFVNLRLAQTWEESREVISAHKLAARCETYASPVPAGVAVLVAAADVQDNRIEAQIIGFGAGEESWLIGYKVFWGSPGVATDPETGKDVWAELEEFLLKQWQHPSGLLMTPAITLVDSGAHADSVYDFVEARQHTKRRVFACKGREFLSAPGLAQEGSAKRRKIRLWNIATFPAKDRIFARMQIPAPGPGYMHLPTSLTEEYFKQVTSEKKITVRDKRTRTSKQEYWKTYARNEALDLTVYCHAGLFVLQTFLAPHIYRDLKALAEQIDKGKDPESAPPQERRVRRFL